MPEIENTDPLPVRRRVTAKTVSVWLLALVLGGTVILALVSREAATWATVCVALALFLHALTTPPTPAIIERHQQPVQIVAGLVAIAAAVVVFAILDGVSGVLLGLSTVLAGIAMLIPGIWPASRTKLRWLVGGTQ